MNKELRINNLEELHIAAEEIVGLLDGNNVFAFYGEMGAGKTTLIKKTCELLGVTDYATSPTFALVNEYHTQQRGSLFHFDFYRINSINELYDIGYEEYIYSGDKCFIEWPEKAEQLLPDNLVKVQINVNPDQSRTIEFNI